MDEAEVMSGRARYQGDVEELVKRLRALSQGGAGRLDYRDIAKVIGVESWKRAARSAVLRAAIEFVEEQDRVVLVRDPGVGVRLGDERHRLAKQRRRSAQITGISAKGLKDLALAREEDMDDEALTERAARIEQFGQVIARTTADGFRLIVDAQGALPSKGALKLFKKAT